jgi:translation initiation factor 1 (eIF-1/SUI1)
MPTISGQQDKKSNEKSLYDHIKKEMNQTVKVISESSKQKPKPFSVVENKNEFNSTIKSQKLKSVKSIKSNKD